jgi:hypothetical protein
MATKRPQVTSVPAQSQFIPGSCDGFALRRTTQKQQKQIAVMAFGFWLDRAFRAGSLQEDWLKAQHQVQKLQQL